MRFLFACCLTWWAVPTFSWNALGHELVAQVAYDNLTPKAKYFCERLLADTPLFAAGSRKNKFIVASTWLDVLKSMNVHQFDKLHYIDRPYSKDGSPLPPVAKQNALTAIQEAIQVLQTPQASVKQKTFSLKVLEHVLGDIHQPLHTFTLVSLRFPQGDLGGNLLFLGSNPVAPNLHQYWDRGAGYLLGPRTAVAIKEKARELESQWPCTAVNLEDYPEDWIEVSHNLAISEVYTIAPRTVPDKAYQLSTQFIVKKQLALAGCRLAAVLNAL